MSAQPELPGGPGRTSSASGLSLNLSSNLSSNNPFRNRAASPALQSPRSPFDDPPPRPVSRNPFLDPNAKPLLSPEVMASSAKAEPTAEELFDTMTLEEKPKSPPAQPGVGRPRGPPPPGARRPGPNVPGRGPPPNHRPSRSQEEEALRAKKPGLKPPPNGRPGHPPHRSRPRSNSDTSIASPDKPLTEEERRKARGHRSRGDKKPIPSKRRDAIDLLDMANVYGVGGVFHHDGPYDALNPHRNRKGSRRAPMQAFPEGSLNNTLGGSGPVNARPDHAAFMGNNDPEAFRDYGVTEREAQLKRGEMPVFDPLSRGALVYGDESLGLGPSTFLEGTPASKTAMQRREIETQQESQELAIKRQKSVAHRVRQLARGPQNTRPGPMTNPEGIYGRQRSPSDMVTPTSGSNNERNPFFNDFEPEQISVRKPSETEPRSPSSPKRSFGIERRATSDATGADGQKPGSGLLARVRSLKGSKRQRPERPTEPSPTTPGPAPGTAA